jgi:hypothetical protein
MTLLLMSFCFYFSLSFSFFYSIFFGLIPLFTFHLGPIGPNRGRHVGVLLLCRSGSTLLNHPSMASKTVVTRLTTFTKLGDAQLLTKIVSKTRINMYFLRINCTNYINLKLLIKLLNFQLKCQLSTGKIMCY